MNQAMNKTYIIADPGEWVSEEQIMALKGLKEGTLKNARILLPATARTFLMIAR